MPLRGARRPPVPQPREGFRAIGRVERPFGLRGEIKILPLTDFPERFAADALVFVRGAERRVRSSRWQKGRVFVALQGVGHVNAAEALRGALVEVPESDLPDFAEGEYYIDQIEGCAVVDADGASVGTIREVLTPGANDVYVVARSGQKDLLIPALRDVVLSVDVEGQRIVVDLPAGLDGAAASTSAPVSLAPVDGDAAMSVEAEAESEPAPELTDSEGAE
ncbi:MAG: 16S rRNA processing protein RimM [Chloroflexi bacterium]|jgi:16S rRNA processing protein RimM|nr:MAG: 16S rRNA processing protein RimM [Chloroflexota bacterium]